MRGRQGGSLVVIVIIVGKAKSILHVTLGLDTLQYGIVIHLVLLQDAGRLVVVFAQYGQQHVLRLDHVTLQVACFKHTKLENLGGLGIECHIVGVECHIGSFRAGCILQLLLQVERTVTKAAQNLTGCAVWSAQYGQDEVYGCHFFVPEAKSFLATQAEQLGHFSGKST